MDALRNTLLNLGAARLILMTGLLIGLTAFFIYIMSQISAPDMDLLYADLDLAESGQIMSKLESMGIDVETRGDGGQIYVPSTQVARLRMMLAESGLPSGGSIGYELFDRTDGLGTSGFVQDINHVRALEGELSRTIKTINGVNTARVHLVLPRRELFSREKQNASASIFLKMRGAKRLSKQQVLAVQQLVAAAIPGLLTHHITVVDDHGTLLARGDGDEATMSGANMADDLRKTYERNLATSIEKLLESSLGPGKARVEVAADINYDKSTENLEKYDPEGQVVRSSQSTVDSSTDMGGDGYTPETVQNNLPGAAPGAIGGGPAAGSTSNRTSETTNYEISKTVTTLIREGGQINRLSVAVLVDGDYGLAADGKKTYKPRTEEELMQIKSLVRSAVGFQESRGDILEVVNMAFYRPEIQEDESVEDFFMGFSQASIFKMIEILVFGIVGILVVLLIIRPVINKLLEGGSGGSSNPLVNASMAQLASTKNSLNTGDMLGNGQIPQAPNQTSNIQAQQTATNSAASEVAAAANAGGSQESLIDMSQLDAKLKGSAVKQIEGIVEKHPEEAASIVRAWMHQDK